MSRNGAIGHGTASLQPAGRAHKSVASKDSSTGEERGPSDRGPRTLAIDIGGSRIKASVLDARGMMLAPRLQVPTPVDRRPEAVIGEIEKLVKLLPAFDRISVGFPGVVRGGKVVTAPNLGTADWAGFNLAGTLAEHLDRPVRMLNDAAVQGLGVVQGHGVECVMTLGTGVGCSLFRNGRFLLHLEFGQHRARKKLSWDQYIGQAALDAAGPERWNRRVRKAIATLNSLTNYDVLYVGGGNARRIAGELPSNVVMVSNTAGVTGGVRLWEPELDELFAAT